MPSIPHEYLNSSTVSTDISHKLTFLNTPKFIQFKFTWIAHSSIPWQNNRFNMEDLINAVTGVVQSFEQFSVNTLEKGMDDLSKKATESEVLKQKKKEEFNKKVAAFKEVAISRFSEIDKQELYNTFVEVADKVKKNDEQSYKEASKTMDAFVKKYKKKKWK